MVSRHVIEIQNVEVGFIKSGRKHTVAAFDSLIFDRGEFVAVVGINGAGKSTLLRTMSGLQPPLSGDILLHEKEIRRYPLNDLAKAVSIVLTQKVGGFNLRVRDAVASGQMPYTNAFHRLEEKHLKVVGSAMEKAGVSAFADLLLHELSDGMYQKTMIARALAQNTDLLLLDEPSAFLDYASKHDLFILLRSLCLLEKKCVLISTHELDLVLKYCDKVLLISEGRGRLVNANEALADDVFRNMAGGYL